MSYHHSTEHRAKMTPGTPEKLERLEGKMLHGTVQNTALDTMKGHSLGYLYGM